MFSDSKDENLKFSEEGEDYAFSDYAFSDDEQNFQQAILSSLTTSQLQFAEANFQEKLWEARYLRHSQDAEYEKSLVEKDREKMANAQAERQVIITDTDDDDEDEEEEDLKPLPETVEELRLARIKFFSKF